MHPTRSTLTALSRLLLAMVVFTLVAVGAYAQERGSTVAGRPAAPGKPVPTFSGTTALYGKVKGELLAAPPKAPWQMRRKVDGLDRDGDGMPDRHELPTVPEGPFVRSGGPAPASPSLHRLDEKEGVGARANTDAISFAAITNLNAAATSSSTSVVMEPTTASKGNTVMYAGNWFAAISVNGGSTFSYINPYTLFPASDGGFCCDQVLQYIPSIDRFVWLLQYVKNGSSENRQRVATASPAQAAAGTWSYFDITSQSLSYANQWLDYPALGVSSGYLYLTSNVFNSADNFTRSLCIRFALSDIADAGSANFFGFSVNDTGSLHPSQNSGTRAIIAAHNNTSSLRLYHWDDGGANAVIHNVTVPSWSGGPFSSITPGGYNWLARVDSRVTASTVVGAEVWVGWSAAAGGAHAKPMPYANIVRVDTSTFAFLGDEPLISFSTSAAAYPSLNTNSNGEVAVTYAWGGGGTFVPNTAVGFLTGGDRRHYSVTSGTHGPSAQVWGDYLTMRVDGQNAALFSATGYALVGGSTNGASVPTYIRFGRASDAGGTIQTDIYEADDTSGTAKTLNVGQTQYRNIHVVANLDFATFTLATTANVSLSTDGATGDTVMSLYGPNNPATLVTSDDDSGNGNFSLISATLAPGTYWVKIEEFGNNSTLPAYSLAMTATVPSVQVTFPNGGETLNVGSSQNITWTSANVSGNVKIEFSTDGGSNYSTVIADTPNDGSHTWTVPNSPTAMGRVKVSMVDGSANDASNANFSVVVPSITVTSPNGGETLNVGASHTITWNSTNVSGNVMLEYSTNGGGAWTTILGSTANDGSESWTVPNSLTTTGRVRVSTLDLATTDMSNSNFTIQTPPSTITVTFPNGGETLVAGTSQNITWTSSNVSGNVQLQFSSDGGSNWVFVGDTANDGSEAWTVPAITTSLGRIRVVALSGGASDISNANFTIVQPTLTVTAPNGGESYVAGSSQTITWTSANVSGNVKLEFSSDGGANFTTLSANTANDGSESWTVPMSGTAQGRIRVSAVNGSATDQSNSNFTVLLPTLTVTLPNGGESFPINSAQTITWTSANVSGNVKLEYSSDGGSNWIVLNASTANDGSEGWTVPGTPTTQARIRVSALDGSAADTSNGNFTAAYVGGMLKAPASIKFGTVKRLKPKTVKVVLQNLSSTQNLVVSVAASGAPFTVTSGSGPFTIPAKKKLTVSVLFAPTMAGSYTGTLMLTTSDPLNPTRSIPITAKAQ